MIDRPACETLNALLDAENQTLLMRLSETQPFLDAADTRTLARVRQVIENQARRCQRLIETVDALDGVPRAPSFNMISASTHYLQLEYLLPALIGEKRRLVGLYQRAGERNLDPRAAAAVSENLAAHQRDLQALEEMTHTAV